MSDSGYMKLKLECLKLATMIVVAHKQKLEAALPVARQMFQFLIEDSDATDIDDDEGEPERIYVGNNHPRNLTHMHEGKQIWPKPKS